MFHSSTRNWKGKQKENSQSKDKKNTHTGKEPDQSQTRPEKNVCLLNAEILYFDQESV